MAKGNNLAEVLDKQRSLMQLTEYELQKISSLEQDKRREIELYQTGTRFFDSFVGRLELLQKQLKHLRSLKKEEAILDAGVLNEARRGIVVLLHELAYDAELLHRVIQSFSRLDGFEKDDLDMMAKALGKVIEAKKKGIKAMEAELKEVRKKITQAKHKMISGGVGTDPARLEEKMEQLGDLEEKLRNYEKAQENMFDDLWGISKKLKAEVEKFVGNMEYVKTTLSNAIATLNDFSRVADPNDSSSVSDFRKQADALFDRLEGELEIVFAAIKKLQASLKKVHKYENLAFGLQVKLHHEGDKEVEELKKANQLFRMINAAKQGLSGL